MEYRRLGNSGLMVSVVGLGTNAFGSRASAQATKEVLACAIDQGITLIDTADNYSGGQSETLIGDILGERRHQVVLATKAGLPAGSGPNDRGTGRLHLMAQVDQSLRRLKTDYIDLFQVHTFDEGTPLEETLKTLDDLVRAGKVRYIGASNYRAWELMKALGESRRLHLERFISVQPSYSLADRVPEAELIPCCLDQGVGLIAYFPLAGGLLTGKYRVGEEPPAGSRAVTTPGFGQRLLKDTQRMALAEGVAAVARELSVTPSQLALAWLIHQPGVASAIAGATRAEQVLDNAGAVSVPWTQVTSDRLAELSAHFTVERFSEARL